MCMSCQRCLLILPSLPPSLFQVVVIENGQVVEEGTHQELIACGGVYKQLVLRQLSAGEKSGKLEDSI